MVTQQGTYKVLDTYSNVQTLRMRAVPLQQWAALTFHRKLVARLYATSEIERCRTRQRGSL